LAAGENREIEMNFLVNSASFPCDPASELADFFGGNGEFSCAARQNGLSAPDRISVGRFCPMAQVSRFG
jgi:hypothetical protein